MTDPRDALTETEALAMLERRKQDRAAVPKTTSRPATYVMCGECGATFALLTSAGIPRSGAAALQVHTVAIHGRPASPAERTPIANTEVAPRRG